MHTQGRQPCGGRSRNWSNDAGIRQGTLRITSSHQELGERQGGDPPSEAPAGTKSATQSLSRVQLFVAPRAAFPVLGIFQARILELVSRGSSPPRG